jgi:hypothetical protein
MIRGPRSRLACSGPPDAWRLLVSALLLLQHGCAGSSVDPIFNQPPPAAKIVKIKPGVVVPRTLIVVTTTNLGASAEHVLHLEGSITAASSAGQVIATTLPLRQITVQRGEVQLNEALFQKVGQGVFTGQAHVRSTNEWGKAQGPPTSVSLQFIKHLVPAISDLGDGVVHLNSEVKISGTGILLGTEGKTQARIRGCFLEVGKTGSCAADGVLVDHQEVVQPQSETDRYHGSFIFSPKICGITPGDFKGTVFLTNHHSDGKLEPGSTRSAAFQLQKTRIYRLDQKSASLGQYVDIRGAGFVGGAGGSTSIRLSGTFKPTSGASSPINIDLIPSFENGGLARYVLEEKVGLGSVALLRSQLGTFAGSWTPSVYWGKDKVDGHSIVMSLNLAPVRQVVWIRFNKSWQEGLREFGMLAADLQIRKRIMEVLKRDYLGINLSFRDTEPKDFKLYSRLDIAGLDPNGLGLLGYDNTPGKDVDNKRLYDWLGGVNAVTQQDGYPGYGGVFLRSLLGFSEHPPKGIMKSPLHSPLFDKVFDPFRSDMGGSAMTSAEALNAPKLGACPAGSRPEQVACAIHVLGSVIGSTSSHELGHSLGLSDPYGSATQFHNPGDSLNRLMDAGRDRPFEERAELNGKGPAVFCDDEYKYLKKVLPLDPPSDPPVKRPSCY